MAKVERFEELHCWQKARELVNTVYLVLNEETCQKDFRFSAQIRAAAVSAMAKISEGFSRFHRNSFIRFLDFSQSSTAEVQSLLYVALDQNYIDSTKFNQIYFLTEETKKLILALIKYLNSTNKISGKVVKEIESEYNTEPLSIFFNFPEDFIRKT